MSTRLLNLKEEYKMRYSNENKEKANGVVNTPMDMAAFLAEQIISIASNRFDNKTVIKVLDPAIGEGNLIISIIEKLLLVFPNKKIKVKGFEKDSKVAQDTFNLLKSKYLDIEFDICSGDFLQNINSITEKYDFIIANPPYVRTQILGADKAQQIAKSTGLNGKIDIYYAFLLYMNKVLAQDGVAGYITSNKFLTIKSGSSVRDYMLKNYKIHYIVDFGDTKMFNASVLPCIIIFSKGCTNNAKEVKFTSIYETDNSTDDYVNCGSIFEHIENSGNYKIKNGKIFKIKQGVLRDVNKGALWVITSNDTDLWLNKIEGKTYKHFSDIGKIRVGIKTTADNVFIGDNWDTNHENLELLKPLITHRNAGQIIPDNSAKWKVLYTHTIENGKKVAVDLNNYPNSKAYLETHYEQLSARKYIHKAKRKWFEIWVPQNPMSWANRKIVFRDISAKPEFWIDESGSVVNGDCYWIDIAPTVSEEEIYLALAVANSSFIEKYYDVKFNTKLYSGKRRYMSQYVEQFPIPDPHTIYAQKAISIVKKIITGSKIDTSSYIKEINTLVEAMFSN